MKAQKKTIMELRCERVLDISFPRRLELVLADLAKGHLANNGRKITKVALKDIIKLTEAVVFMGVTFSQGILLCNNVQELPPFFDETPGTRELQRVIKLASCFERRGFGYGSEACWGGD